MLVTQWCYQSGLLKVIGQFSPSGIGCKTQCKVCHWLLVGFDTSIVSQIGLLEFHLLVLFTAWINHTY